MHFQLSTSIIRPAGAKVALAAGILLATSGAWTGHPPVTVTGQCLTVGSLTLIALTVIRGWITDTSAERARLLASVRQADETRGQYIAAQSALASERDRMRRDADYEAAACAALLATERTKMQDEFDEQRAEQICQTFEAAFKMFQAGICKSPRRGTRAVIPFPTPSPQPDGQTVRGASHP